MNGAEQSAKIGHQNPASIKQTVPFVERKRPFLERINIFRRLRNAECEVEILEKRFESFRDNLTQGDLHLGARLRDIEAHLKNLRDRGYFDGPKGLPEKK